MAAAVNGGAGTFYWTMPAGGGTPSQVTFAQFRQLIAPFMADTDTLFSALMTPDLHFVQIPGFICWATSTPGPTYKPNVVPGVVAGSIACLLQHALFNRHHFGG